MPFKNTRHCYNICNNYNTVWCYPNFSVGLGWSCTFVMVLLFIIGILQYFDGEGLWIYSHQLLSHYIIAVAIILEHYGRGHSLCDICRDKFWDSCWGVLPAVPLIKPHPEVRQIPGTPGSPGWPLSPGRPTWPLSPICPGRPSTALPGCPCWPVNMRINILQSVCFLITISWTVSEYSS